jgi:hypothetical protein
MLLLLINLILLLLLTHINVTLLSDYPKPFLFKHRKWQYHTLKWQYHTFSDVYQKQKKIENFMYEKRIRVRVFNSPFKDVASPVVWQTFSASFLPWCWSSTKWTSSSFHWKLACSHHDIAEQLLSWYLSTITHSLDQIKPILKGIVCFQKYIWKPHFAFIIMPPFYLFMVVVKTSKSYFPLNLFCLADDKGTYKIVNYCQINNKYIKLNNKIYFDISIVSNKSQIDKRTKH